MVLLVILNADHDTLRRTEPLIVCFQSSLLSDIQHKVYFEAEVDELLEIMRFVVPCPAF
jgi:hypothetical protein